MKSTIQIISELEQMERVQWGHYSAPRLCTKDARDKLHELQNEVKLLKSQLEQQAHSARPEPSRLEIAAMLKAGRGFYSINGALVEADALIAASKEQK